MAEKPVLNIIKVLIASVTLVWEASAPAQGMAEFLKLTKVLPRPEGSLTISAILPSF